MTRLFAGQAGLYCLSAFIVGVLGVASLTAVFLFAFGSVPQQRFDPLTLWLSRTAAQKFVAVFGLVFGLGTPVLLASRATCGITAAQLAGQQPGLGSVLLDMLRFFPAALVYALIMGLSVMVGYSLLVVPSILIASLFALVVPTGIYENAGIFAAIRRGVSLAGKVMGNLLLFTIASFAVVGVVIALRIFGVDRFLPDSGAVELMVKFTVIYFPSLLVLVLVNIVFTLLYHAARTRERLGPFSVTPAQP
jgi:hypothetical protein